MGAPKAAPPPAPTPPRETSAAQTGSNVSTAIANAYMGNVNQVTPQGSLTFDQTDTYSFTDPYTGLSYNVPRFTATQTLSPEQQAVNQQQNRADLALSTLGANQSEFLRDYMQKPLQLSDLGPRPDAPQLRTSYDTEFTADRQRTEDALFSRLNPQLERDRASLETQLSNQGVKLGSSAYDRAMQNFGQQSNDARTAAVLASGQEQSRLAGLAQQSANFFNSANVDQYNAAMAARSQGLQEQFSLRNQPINEITALMSGSQVSQPNFVNAQMPRIPTTDNAGIIQNYDQAQMQRWQAVEQQRQQRAAQQGSILGGLMGGISSMGAAWLRSDERLKEDIEPVGTLKGHKLYEYTMKDTGEKQIGVMAQEVRKKRPDAVKKDADSGYLKVNYGALFNAGGK
jgi:hypothetical protein